MDAMVGDSGKFTSRRKTKTTSTARRGGRSRRKLFCQTLHHDNNLIGPFFSLPFPRTTIDVDDLSEHILKKLPGEVQDRVPNLEPTDLMLWKLSPYLYSQ